MWLTDRRAIPVLGCATVVVFAAFSIWPALDLQISHMFYNGEVFPVEAQRIIGELRLGVWNATIVMFWLAVALGAGAVLLRRPVLGVAARGWAFVIFVFVAGPGLLVNGMLKRFWGRARPADTTEFGGLAQFSPPYQITDNCASNCSFVSGEVSGSTAMAIALLVILAANRARLPDWAFRMGQGMAILIPVLTAWQRVAAGRHFLSDALLAALFITLIAAVLARVMRLR